MRLLYRLLCAVKVTLLLGAIINAMPHVDLDKKVAREVCYDDIGCFQHFPTDPDDMPLPMSPEEIGTEFILCIRSNSTVERRIIATEVSIRHAGFKPNKKTKFISHGYAPMQDSLADFVPRMKEAILAKEDVNVIMINWVNGANLEYDQSAQNTRVVGAQTAHLMRTISESFNYDPENFHAIGFSLGAHVAGFSGKEFQKHHENNTKIGRITGLDPANPGFNYDNPTVRLDRSDAAFVDVIHTDIKTVLVMAGGMNRNLGHVDFYPNGGNDQPGCNSWNSLLSVTGAAKATVCDHLRAPEYFINSINATEECNFAAYKCPSYAHFKDGRCVRCRGKEHRRKKGGKNRCQTMGYSAKPINSKKQVQYYLQTSESAPYCAKHYQIQMHWRKGHGSSKQGFRGSLYVTLQGTKGATKEFALNDGTTFHIVAGNTSRFLVSQDCTKDIGDIISVSFRWERPTCWTYYFCKTENVYLRRIKIFDASAQKRHVFLPLDMDRNRDGRKDVIPVPAGETQKLMKKSHILKHHRSKFVPVIIPELAEVGDVVSPHKKSGVMKKLHHTKHRSV